MVQILMAPYDPIYENSMLKFLHICFHAVIFIFYFSDRRWSLKIENENNSTKALSAEAPFIGLESIEACV